MFEIDPLAPIALVRDERNHELGQLRDFGIAAVKQPAEPVGGSVGASTRSSWPRAINSRARASTCRFTPPGYVHE